MRALTSSLGNGTGNAGEGERRMRGKRTKSARMRRKKEALGYHLASEATSLLQHLSEKEV